MSEHSADQTLGRELLPVFLGATSSAYRQAAQLHRRYGALSVIADRKRPFRDLLSLNTLFFQLPSSGHPLLTAELLTDWVAHRSETIPLLILCKEEYRPLLEVGATRLETRFILLESDRLTQEPLFADFSR
ncbi:MAG: hypothetical protein IJY42_00125 [Clostridia bacterium]|nr:hypothetical protein [Clostridia bacterium]